MPIGFSLITYAPEASSNFKMVLTLYSYDIRYALSAMLFSYYFYQGFLQIAKDKEGTLKIARRKKTGEISKEILPKIGFFGNAKVSISFRTKWFTISVRRFIFQLVIVRTVENEVIASKYLPDIWVSPMGLVTQVSV